jgi:hypothetical protein
MNRLLSYDAIHDVAQQLKQAIRDINAVKSNRRAPHGTVTLEPWNGILWAHSSPNDNDLTEVRPLDGLLISGHQMS